MSHLYDSLYSSLPYSSYETNRRDVAQGILELQDKMRIRQQLDRNPFCQEINFARLNEHQAELIHRLQSTQQGRYRTIAEERVSHDRYIDRISDEKLLFNHRERLGLLRREQQMLLNSEIANQVEKHQFHLRRVDLENHLLTKDHLRSVDNNQEIARDHASSKAEDYQQNLERYYQQKICNDKKNSRLINPGFRSIQYNEYQNPSANKNSQKRHRNSNKGNSDQKSPFGKLADKDENNKKSYLEDTGTDPKGSSDRKKRDPGHDRIQAYQTLSPQVRRNDGSPMNGLRTNQKDKGIQSGNQSISHYRKMSSQKLSQKKASRRNSRSSKKRDRSMMMKHQIQADAMKKIENRLKLSEIVYRDSQCRNIKHEMNHLLNTYDNELKIRQEIKDRINNNPQILRKHKMVVPQ